ncbi:MAG: hypothetical protein H6825_09630 [Planctomycetes bacterium]|nr:hypothetical protein [Planctomycetota bacterium]
MVGKLNYAIRTVVLGALVGLGWLGFVEVKGVLAGHERELVQRDERIAQLDADLSEKLRQVDGLRADVAARDARIGELDEQVAQQRARIAELELALRYLKVDRRLARLTVLGQKLTENGEVEATLVRFEDVDEQGEPVGEAVETWIPGRFAYVESLVIKFDDAYVEAGDAFRGASLCLFRRIFSEQQKPSEGVAIDSVGERPEPYAGDDEPELVQRLWARFWDYANDPDAAAAAGVRAIHGEAPFVELREGKSYSIELRASGGLSIKPR